MNPEENIIKTTMRYHFTVNSIAVTKKPDISKCMGGNTEKSDPPNLLMEA